MAITIACGQMEVIPGRPDLNTAKIKRLMEQAKAEAVDLLLLPEMAVPGYLIGDLWEQQAFLDDCEAYGREIIQAATGGLTVIFGNVALDREKVNEDGRIRKYNAAFVAQEGQTLPGEAGYPFLIKNSLPNYREFDDKRYFYALSWLCAEKKLPLSKALQPVEMKFGSTVLPVGVFLCEDGWTENYNVDVPSALAKNGAQLLVNLSCSPYTLGKNGRRHLLFGQQAKSLHLPLIYCNNVGIQNNGKNIYTYDGCSCIYGPEGQVQAAAPIFEECLLRFSYDFQSGAMTAMDNTMPSLFEEQALCRGAAPAKAKRGRRAGKNPAAALNLPNLDGGLNLQKAEAEVQAEHAGDPQAEIAHIYQAVKYGTSQFLRQCGIKKMVIGLSGGIDSAVTAALFTDILGPRNVLLVNMPSKFNSGTTKNLARQIATNLGASYTIISIQDSVEHTITQLSDTPIHNYLLNRDFKLELNGLMKENIQARDRGSRLLAGLASAFGGAFSCNSNKSEITVGYATFYGDICGLVAPLGDLWKHQVYALGKYYNETVYKKEVLPAELFTIRPSAELSDAQTVGRGGDPLVYEYHDYLFRSFLESWRKTSPLEILKHFAAGDLAQFIGCQPGLPGQLFKTTRAFCEDLERWFRLFAGFAVAKRIQAPPVVSLSRRAYGYDQREAQLAPYFSRAYLNLKEELLNQETDKAPEAAASPAPASDKSQLTPEKQVSSEGKNT